MSFVQYVRGSRVGPGSFLAVPSYGDIATPFVHSLFSSQANLPHRMDLEIFSGNCHVDDSRNRLVRDFLETDCEQLVFLDNDVFWRDSDLDRLIRHDRDIVAGIYPLKNDKEDYPVKTLPGERWSDKDGLVEVEGVPTGFLKIKRRVFEALYPTVPHHKSKEDAFGRMMIPVIFERTLNGHSRRGGDYEFCRKAREAGFQIYIDPMMELGHVGNKVWTGCIGHFWRKDFAIPEGLTAIKEGAETTLTFAEMVAVWGNNWSVSAELLFTLVKLARKATGPILDTGSGLSSLVMAAATDQKVYALEQSPMWAAKVADIAKKNGLDNLEVIQSDIVEGWYSVFPRMNYGLVTCDGPSGDDKRDGLFKLLKDEISQATIVVDDIDRKQSRLAAEGYARAAGRNLTIIPASRNFGIIQ
jgi:predicted O-methyltransferase YrrM